MTETAAPGVEADFGADPQVLESLGINFEEYSYLAQNPMATLPRGRVTKFVIGEDSTFRASITSGFEVEAGCRIDYAKLNRVTILTQNHQQTGVPYTIVSGSINPIKPNIWMYLPGPDGEVRMSMFDFLQGLYNHQAPDGFKADAGRFNEKLKSIGIPLNGDMVLFWQHMGAKEEKVAELIDLLKSMSFTDATSGVQNPGRIQQVFQAPQRPDGQGGIPLAWIEIGRQDRSRSRTGQGFRDFIEAIQANFERSNRLRAVHDALVKEFDQKKGSMDEAQQKAAQAQISAALSAVTSWMNNMAGSQEGQVAQPGGGYQGTGRWFTTAAPMGRFALMKAGSVFEVDLWKNQQEAMAAIAASGGEQTQVAAENEAAIAAAIGNAGETPSTSAPEAGSEGTSTTSEGDRNKEPF